MCAPKPPIVKITNEKIYRDRYDAGRQLARMLERYGNAHSLVFGIPRGGILVASEVAKHLRGELSTIITKKLPHPFHPEYSIGAVAEDGSAYLLPDHEFPGSVIQMLITSQSTEIERRKEKFRNGESLPDMHGRCVIVCDDGIATGSTLLPALQLCKNNGAARIIAAAPVSGDHYVPAINEIADEVIIVEQLVGFHAVAEVYEDFHELTDTEVREVIEGFNFAKE